VTGGPVAGPETMAATGQTGTEWSAELKFAIDLAGLAGQVLMDRYERLERIHHKTARDLVTEADHLS
jgi:hypothetical protein